MTCYYSYYPETKFYHVIKFDQWNASLVLRYDKQASALWPVYYTSFSALIAMFEWQNWNQSVFWQINTLLFSISTKTFDLVKILRILYTGHKDHLF